MDSVCIGTAQFGMTYGISNQSGQTNVHEVLQIVETAVKKGIFYYDTAHSYGTSETVLGEAFRALENKNVIKVVTKLSPDFVFTTYTELKKHVTDTINRLNLKSLWGLLIHRTEIKGDRRQFINALAQLKKDGLIQNFGVSIYHPNDALRLAGDPHVDIIQVPFNIMDRRLLDNGFFKTAQKMQKKVFIRSVFLQGLILMGEDHIKEKNMTWAIPYITELHKYTKEHETDLKTFALKGVIKRVPWARLIIGLENNNQLEENIRLMNENNISDSVIHNWWAKLPLYPEKLLNPALW